MKLRFPFDAFEARTIEETLARDEFKFNDESAKSFDSTGRDAGKALHETGYTVAGSENWKQINVPRGWVNVPRGWANVDSKERVEGRISTEVSRLGMGQFGDKAAN